MICKNCGAIISEDDARCPYCRAMNEPGAKKQFDKKLNNMAEELGELSTQPKRVLLRHSTKLFFLVAGGILLVLVLILLAISWNRLREQREKREYEEEQTARIAWENRVFPQLDEWYENLQFETIIEFRKKLWEENQEYDIYRWRHEAFISIYDYYYDCTSYEKKLNEGVTLEWYDTADALYGAMKLIYECSKEALANYIPKDPDHSSWGLTSQELIYIEEYRTYAKNLITNQLNMSEEEIEDLHQQCMKENYVIVCNDYAKKRAEE